MIVLTIGTFDLPHMGHYKLFKRCAELAGQDGEVVIGVNTDAFVRQYKGAAPIMTLQERIATINQWGFARRFVENNSQDAKPCIEEIGPDLIVIGSDWLRKDYMAQLQVTPDWLDAKGISLCYVPYTWSVSTSELKRRIREN